MWPLFARRVVVDDFRESLLEAYLDEALPPPEMARIETRLRDEPALLARLQAVLQRRDRGVHSLGAIWRWHRLTCPSRQELGNFLLHILPERQAAYVRFHLDVIGCRWCRANLEDLFDRQPDAAGASRRQRYFESSASYLSPRRADR